MPFERYGDACPSIMNARPTPSIAAGLIVSKHARIGAARGDRRKPSGVEDDRALTYNAPADAEVSHVLG
jgi:hypothetical protein